MASTRRIGAELAVISLFDLRSPEVRFACLLWFCVLERVYHFEITGWIKRGLRVMIGVIPPSSSCSSIDVKEEMRL